MMLRSLLFVPGDSVKKLTKATGSGADAVILDLEDSVSDTRKGEARKIVVDFLQELDRSQQTPKMVIRVNALDTGWTDDDLAAVIGAKPDAILLPKAASGADLQDIGGRISVLEARANLPDGSVKLHALMTETAGGMLNASSFSGKSTRLEALAWGAEDLAAVVGASANRDENGVYTDVFRMARTLTLLSAADAGVEPIDTVYTDFRDLDGLNRECLAAARDGFSGKMAIHPNQVEIINAAFTPPQADIDRARRIMQLFAEAGPDAGVLSMDGKMIDMPHFRQAERVLRRSGLDPFGG